MESLALVSPLEPQSYGHDTWTEFTDWWSVVAVQRRTSPGANLYIVHVQTVTWSDYIFRICYAYIIVVITLLTRTQYMLSVISQLESSYGLAEHTNLSLTLKVLTYFTLSLQVHCVYTCSVHVGNDCMFTSRRLNEIYSHYRYSTVVLYISVTVTVISNDGCRYRSTGSHYRYRAVVRHTKVLSNHPHLTGTRRCSRTTYTSSIQVSSLEPQNHSHLMYTRPFVLLKKKNTRTSSIKDNSSQPQNHCHLVYAGLFSWTTKPATTTQNGSLLPQNSEGSRLDQTSRRGRGNAPGLDIRAGHILLVPAGRVYRLACLGKGWSGALARSWSAARVRLYVRASLIVDGFFRR